MKNILTVDLESATHAHKFFGNLTSSERKRLDDNYILKSTNFLLKLFEECNITATFFVLGEIYEWYPDLVKKIYSKGHEIGYHTHEHAIVNNGNLLEVEIKKSNKFFRDYKIKGFRAPFCKLERECFAVLKKYGFKYDSSIYSYVDLFEVRDGIIEIPISSFLYNNFARTIDGRTFPRHLTVKMLFCEIPFGSGYFLGLLQKRIRYFINKLNSINKPALLVVHPWQISRPSNIYFLSNRFLISNPQWLPDSFDIKQSLIYLCKEFNFESIENLIDLN